MATNVLLLKAGQAAPEVRRTIGDYDRMFVQAIAHEPSCRLHVHLTHLGEALPARARDWDAIWMTGSPHSVRRLEPWMRSAGEFMREAAEQGVPVLGVCFGHQLLGWAYGARVVKNPLGREIGTVDITLTEAGLRDPLMRGIEPQAAVQTTHEDLLEALPEGATLLAENGCARVQAMGIGDHVRGVQFHPEIDAAGMRAMIEARSASLEEAAVERGEAPGTRVRTLLAGLRPTRAGKQLLGNFLEHFT